MKPNNRIKKYVSGIKRNCIYKLTKNKQFFLLESNDLYKKYCSK
jgi:hypothetical protein